MAKFKAMVEAGPIPYDRSIAAFTVVSDILKDAGSKDPYAAKKLFNAAERHVMEVNKQLEMATTPREKEMTRLKILQWQTETDELVPYQKYDPDTKSMCRRDAQGCGGGSMVEDEIAPIDADKIDTKAEDEITSIDADKIDTKAEDETQLYETTFDAEKIEAEAEKSFGPLLEEHGLGVENPGSLFKEMKVRLPSFSESFSTIRSFEIPGSELAWGLLYFWGENMRNVFKNPASTGLDKATSVLSLVPVLGCSLSLADSVQHRYVDAVGTDICYIGDAFTLIGLPEIGIPLQFASSLRSSIYERPDRPDYANPDYYLAQRKNAWDAFLGKTLHRLETVEFIANLTQELEARRRVVLQRVSHIDAAIKLGRRNDTAYLKKEMRRHTCAAMAEAKYHLQELYINKTIEETAKAAESFRENFAYKYLQVAAEDTAWFTDHVDVGETIRDAIFSTIEPAADWIRQTLERTMQRIATKPPCLCGTKNMCEFRDCHTRNQTLSPYIPNTSYRAYLLQSVKSEMELFRFIGDGCEDLLLTCPASTGDTSRPLWCHWEK